MQEFLDQNPIETFIDFEDPQFQHLKDPGSIETYVTSHGGLLVEFDKRIWEMHSNPKIKEWREQGELKKAIDKLRDDLVEGNFSCYFRKVAIFGPNGNWDISYRIGEVSLMNIGGDNLEFGCSHTVDPKSGNTSIYSMSCQTDQAGTTSWTGFGSGCGNAFA